MEHAGGWARRYAWDPAGIALAAAVALFRFQVGVLPLLGGCAAAGMLLQWLG